MRLLNISTFMLEEFYSDIPEYAILSHTWGEGEVSMKSLNDGTGRGMKGWAKIEGCCSLARKDGWEYVWIDTCCIDKTSSADLSEAINSMFTWYKESSVCYAYLSDVQTDSGDLGLQFRESRWFTRGWTLQELLAPIWIIFLDQSWAEIGTKSSLFDDISKSTRISTEHLKDFGSCSIATKMSWAAFRETSRIEDKAYCLMGLFGVNMPLLYGEGRRAFTRLQHELIKLCDDESIFAWQNEQTRFMKAEGFFAPSPRFFGASANIRPSLFDDNPRRRFTMTNKGLSFIAPLYKRKRWDEDRPIFLLGLNCSRDPSASPEEGVFIEVSCRKSNTGFNDFIRTRQNLLSFKYKDLQQLPEQELILKDRNESGVDWSTLLHGSFLSCTYPAIFYNFSWKTYKVSAHSMMETFEPENSDLNSNPRGSKAVFLKWRQMLIAELELKNRSPPVRIGISVLQVNKKSNPKIKIWERNKNPTNIREIYDSVEAIDKPQGDTDILLLKSKAGGRNNFIKAELRPRGLEERFKHSWFKLRQFNVQVTYEQGACRNISALRHKEQGKRRSDSY